MSEKNPVIKAKQIAFLQSMANSKLKNYAGIPGLTSSLLGGPSHGKVRLFECSRDHQESLVPHSHRFDLMCMVLCGEVENHIWKEWRDGDDFTETELVYLGAPGCLKRGESKPPKKYVKQTRRYGSGDFYSIDSDEIHSINFSRGTVVLFFEGPDLNTNAVILEPFVNGKTVQTFQLQPWMYERELDSSQPF